MTQLIITLPLELPEAASTALQLDYVLSPDGRTMASHSRAALALLPAPSNAEVVAVVPAQALSWHEVVLPKGLLAKGFLSEAGSPRLRSVLEGLLEERLLDEPSQLHFALAPDARDGSPMWVAACDRAWLRGWLQLLEASRHTVARIVPEFAPGDSQAVGAGSEPGASGAGADVLHVIGTPQQAHIVFSPRESADDATQKTALSVLPLSASSVALANWPEALPILAEPAVAALAEGLFKRRVDLQQNTQRWLHASQSSWDLAQFDLQNNSRSRTWKRVTTLASSLLRAPRWRAARWATAALVLVNLAGLNAWAWSERSSVEAKRAAIKEVLTSTFPQVKVVVDAPVQMARELALLRQAAGGTSNTDFDSLLMAVGGLGAGSTSPSAIDYAASEIRIKGLGVSAAQVAQAADQFTRQGLRASVEADTLSISAKAAP
jgi:general secretion pathway protein L